MEIGSWVLDLGEFSIGFWIGSGWQLVPGWWRMKLGWLRVVLASGWLRKDIRNQKPSASFAGDEERDERERKREIIIIKKLTYAFLSSQI